MKLYIKQKVFSWGDQFYIYDENEKVKYSVKGEIFSFGKKLHIYDTMGNEIAFIHQKLLSLLPKFYISENGIDVAEVNKIFTLFKPKYYVTNLDWEVTGDFLAHEYNISSNINNIAVISKKWFTWGDTYEVDVMHHHDEIMVLSIVLIIDAIQAANNVTTSVDNND